MLQKDKKERSQLEFVSIESLMPKDHILRKIDGAIDFTDFPMPHFYYGSDKVLYAEAEYFAKAYEKYGAEYEMHIGEGMFHCYPMMPFFPEAKAAYNEIIDILK